MSRSFLIASKSTNSTSFFNILRQFVLSAIKGFRADSILPESILEFTFRIGNALIAPWSIHLPGIFDARVIPTFGPDEFAK